MRATLRRVVDFAGKIRDDVIIFVTRSLEKQQALPPDAVCWLTPVRSDEKQSAEQIIQSLVGDEGIYALAGKTSGRKNLRPGHFICFYAVGKGVIADAQVASKPEMKTHPRVGRSEERRWLFHLKEPHLYLNNPIVINARLRSQLNAFKNRDPAGSWGWLVRTTRTISVHDFKCLTRTTN